MASFPLNFEKPSPTDIGPAHPARSPNAVRIGGYLKGLFRGRVLVLRKPKWRRAVQGKGLIDHKEDLSGLRPDGRWVFTHPTLADVHISNFIFNEFFQD